MARRLNLAYRESVMSDEANYLEGQLLIAMPGMADPRFERAVIYMCAHSAAGAMGLVINRLVEHISFAELLTQLGIDPSTGGNEIRVHFGGPVEMSRGLVLHSADYSQDVTMIVDEHMALTASMDVLRAIASGEGPSHSLLALGYAGWAPGQLETEIQANGWLHGPADLDFVFDGDLDGKWQGAVAKIGFEVGRLSGEAGHA